MKTLFISPNTAVSIGNTEEDIKQIPLDHVSSYDQLLIEEPTKIISQIGERRYTTEADADDIVVLLYNSGNTRMIIVKSPEWAEVIREKRKEVQLEKERWAKNHSEESTDK